VIEIRTTSLRLWSDLRAAIAVEFALLFPIVIFFVLSLFEFGLIIYDYHLISEATRRGARYVVVKEGVDEPLLSLTGLLAADKTCTGAGCNSTPFGTMLTDMQIILPDLVASNVTLTYSNTGLTSGDLVTPRVTVEIVNYQHSSVIYGAVLGNTGGNNAFTFTYPSFATSRVLASRAEDEL
jgi:Flp pilus assembly protein TadG